MKRYIALAAIATAFLGYAFAADSANDTRNLPPPEVRARALEKHLGGFIIQPGTLNGKFAFIDMQNVVAHDSIVASADSVRVAQRIDVVVQNAVFGGDILEMGEAFERSGANGAVFLVDRAGLPTLLIAPEARWGIVNVAALRSDGQDGERLAQRVHKEILRGFAMVCGAADTGIPGCALQPVLSLKDLDDSAAVGISMQRQVEMEEHMQRMGITPFRRISYRQAVREGWAPAPTNEWQQAIWDKHRDGAAKQKATGRRR